MNLSNKKKMTQEAQTEASNEMQGKESYNLTAGFRRHTDKNAIE
jgi:hypothetical protein